MTDETRSWRQSLPYVLLGVALFYVVTWIIGR